MKQILILFLLFFVSAQAKTYKYNELNFNLNNISDSDIHYSFKLINKYQLKNYDVLFNHLYDEGMNGVAGTNLVLVKSIFIVNKPVNFFKYQTMVDLNYNRVVTGAARVIDKGGNTLRFQTNGMLGYDYDMTLLLKSFDYESKSITAQNIFADFQFQDSSLGEVETIAARIGRNFSSKGNGSVAVTNHIGKGSKTIFVTYSIVSLKPLFAWGDIVEANVLKEIQNLRDRTNNY